MFLELHVQGIVDPILVNVNSISTINDRVIKMNNQDVLELSKESLQKLLLTIVPREKKVKDGGPKPELQELFDQLFSLTGGKGLGVFTASREKKLKDLLTKHRMTKENLIAAATNIGKDVWLQGENDNHKRYGDIDYLLRPDKAAKYSEEQAKKQKGMF